MYWHSTNKSSNGLRPGNTNRTPAERLCKIWYGPLRKYGRTTVLILGVPVVSGPWSWNEAETVKAEESTIQVKKPGRKKKTDA